MKTAHLTNKLRASPLKTYGPIEMRTYPVATEDCWMTSREAADYLRVSTKRLLNMVSAGQIPYHKLGRTNRYKRSELEQLLTRNKRGPIYD